MWREQGVHDVSEARPPQLGLALPVLPLAGATFADLGEHAATAEAAGAASVWVTDHLLWHVECVDALIASALLAGATSTCLVGTCVLQLPLRATGAVAKQTAFISELAAGRFVLGVGVGERADEYRDVGVDFATRGARLEVMVDELRALWARTGDHRVAPSRGDVPIWVGGRTDLARRRAARIGSGWIPMFLTPPRLASALQALDRELDDLGRDPAAFTRAVAVYVSVEADDASHARNVEWLGRMFNIPAGAVVRHVHQGDAQACSEAIERYVEAGAEHIIACVLGDAPLERFAEVAGAFRSRR
jgi:alkanesulfonate monooxygenase SsuD/methylene tetrahydromethanopterin reductase-like flavin-dependent oxidoreductase (luciferase family)